MALKTASIPRQKKSAATTGPAPRSPIPKPGAITPEPGWQARSGYGVMKTPDGVRLVALADLARWLRERDELTTLQAVNAVINALTVDDLKLLWFTNYHNPSIDADGGAWRREMAEDGVDLECPFPLVNPEGDRPSFAMFAPQVPRRFRELKRGGQSSPELDAWLAKPEGERKHEMLKERLRGELFFAFENPFSKDAGEVISKSFLAIPIHRAHECWGWGSAAPAAGDGEQAKEQGEEWSGERLFHESKALKAKGSRRPTQDLAELSGLSGREVRRRIAKYAASTSAAKANVVRNGLLYFR